MPIIPIKTTRNLLLAGALSWPAWSIADTCQPSLIGRHANLKPAEVATVVTGNAIADERVRAIAQARGYRPQVQLADRADLTFPWSVHRCVVTAWEKLRLEAEAAGYELSIVSGYRSLARQRQIFLSKLFTRGVTPELIAAGEADDELNAILDFSAPPGYSRHHSGFTIDIQAGHSGLNAFGATEAYRWIAADDFRIARSFGFLPSYPEEMPHQGPLPEPWEFIWVGDTAALGAATPAANDFLESARLIMAALLADDDPAPRTARAIPHDDGGVVDTLPGG